MRGDLPFEEYLETCSDTSLENFMLTARSSAANLEKSLRKDFEKLIELKVNAEVATLLLRGDIGRIVDRRQRRFRFEDFGKLEKAS